MGELWKLCWVVFALAAIAPATIRLRLLGIPLDILVYEHER
jgi:hypothetical protein